MNFRFNWDAMGIATSLLCAIHCAVLPLMLSSIQVFGVNIIGNHTFEYLMVVLTGVIGIYSLWHGYSRHHRLLLPIGIFAAGTIFLLARLLWHDYELYFLPAAVILIIGAHALNYRGMRVAAASAGKRNNDR